MNKANTEASKKENTALLIPNATWKIAWQGENGYKMLDIEQTFNEIANVCNELYTEAANLGISCIGGKKITQKIILTSAGAASTSFGIAMVYGKNGPVKILSPLGEVPIYNKCNVDKNTTVAPLLATLKQDATIYFKLRPCNMSDTFLMQENYKFLNDGITNTPDFKKLLEEAQCTSLKPTVEKLIKDTITCNYDLQNCATSLNAQNKATNLQESKLAYSVNQAFIDSVETVMYGLSFIVAFKCAANNNIKLKNSHIPLINLLASVVGEATSLGLHKANQNYKEYFEHFKFISFSAACGYAVFYSIYPLVVLSAAFGVHMGYQTYFNKNKEPIEHYKDDLLSSSTFMEFFLNIILKFSFTTVAEKFSSFINFPNLSDNLSEIAQNDATVKITKVVRDKLSNGGSQIKKDFSSDAFFTAFFSKEGGLQTIRSSFNLALNKLKEWFYGNNTEQANTEQDKSTANTTVVDKFTEENITETEQNSTTYENPCIGECTNFSTET